MKITHNSINPIELTQREVDNLRHFKMEHSKHTQSFIYELPYVGSLPLPLMIKCPTCGGMQDVTDYGEMW